MRACPLPASIYFPSLLAPRLAHPLSAFLFTLEHESLLKLYDKPTPVSFALHNFIFVIIKFIISSKWEPILGGKFRITRTTDQPTVLENYVGILV